MRSHCHTTHLRRIVSRHVSFRSYSSPVSLSPTFFLLSVTHSCFLPPLCHSLLLSSFYLSLSLSVFPEIIAFLCHSLQLSSFNLSLSFIPEVITFLCHSLLFYFFHLSLSLCPLHEDSIPEVFYFLCQSLRHYFLPPVIVFIQMKNTHPWREMYTPCKVVRVSSLPCTCPKMGGSWSGSNQWPKTETKPPLFVVSISWTFRL